ncbi:uncharacterized protein C1orf115 homolog [Heterocephalus glaber]|uniref:Uncharacterized protein C1orf115 homolog n=1 Tax=Heterocephalus glaber TaxID=10181 RepID=A0AAX6S3B1_HETGA|nr:uncharacterized protein C1orf115 homolog [Heterocephalus glaber]
MALGAALRARAGGGLTHRWVRCRARARGDEDAQAVLDAEAEAPGRADPEGAQGPHPASRPEPQPQEEAAPGEARGKRRRRRLKKCGKNVGKVVTKGCRYLVLGLQSFAAAYSSPFAVGTSVVSLVR